MSLAFAAFDQRPPGTLAEMLVLSYAPLLSEVSPETAAELRRSWQEFDREVYEQAETVGRCGFLTLMDGDLIGFGSWDPRGGPAMGRIGHNCVRPDWQRRGYGQSQLKQILGWFKARGFASAEARTGEQEFFEPARRMYVRCGFMLVGRTAGILGPAHGTLIYRADLEGAA